MYEVTGLEVCSREFEVRFWWKKSLRQVLPVFLAGELAEQQFGSGRRKIKPDRLRNSLNL
jgi:hypothetical protein